MTKNEDPKKESLAEIAVDPDVLARELALEIEIDPLEQIDEDAFSKNLNILIQLMLILLFVKKPMMKNQIDDAFFNSYAQEKVLQRDINIYLYLH